MKNVLFIGPYRQKDGWGESAKDYVQALSRVKSINLKISPIYMGITPDHDIGEYLTEIENRSYNHYDVVIQNVLPHLFSYDGDMKNIGLFYLETQNLQDTLWPRCINLMDEAWLSSMFEIQSLWDSGINDKKVVTRNIPIPVNIEKFSKEYDECNIPDLKDNYVFYFIGENTPRKNIESLLIAFHREFSTTENAKLIIKTNRGGLTANETLERLHNQIIELKKKLRIYKNPKMYKNEIVITEYVPENALMALHKAGDCFVMPSFGEACCRPAIDALGFGNRVIGLKNSGLGSTLEMSSRVDLVGSQTTPVITTEPPMEEIYTTREAWEQVNIIELQEAMRHAYDQGKAKSQARPGAYVERFSYDNSAELIDKALNDNGC